MLQCYKNVRDGRQTPYTVAPKCCIIHPLGTDLLFRRSTALMQLRKDKVIQVRDSFHKSCGAGYVALQPFRYAPSKLWGPIHSHLSQSYGPNSAKHVFSTHCSTPQASKQPISSRSCAPARTKLLLHFNLRS